MCRIANCWLALPTLLSEMDIWTRCIIGVFMEVDAFNSNDAFKSVRRGNNGLYIAGTQTGFFNKLVIFIRIPFDLC